MPLCTAIEAMGTRFELVLAGEASTRLAAAAEEALEEIASCEARWSRFRSDSLVARIGRLREGEELLLAHEDFELLAAGELGRHQSRGAFDLRLGSWMAWELGHARARTRALGRFALQRESSQLRCLRAPVELDLGAIAKGFALDLAARVLRRAGVERALLHGGTSSVLALGAPPDREGWEIALEPGTESASVCLRDAALSLSGSRGRRTRGGAPHVLDPRSATPIAREGRALALAPTATVAEIWSTAALVNGDLEGAPDEVRGARRLDHEAHWRALRADSRLRIPDAEPSPCP